MVMTPPRQHLALAVDGGGMKGLIVAQALIALEQQLGSKPLIEHPSLKILAGTSTGSLITGGIALGMTAAEIAAMYATIGAEVFPDQFPRGAVAFLRPLARVVLGLLRPALYSSDPLKAIVRQAIERKTGNPDLTMGELGKRLRPNQALIVTTMDIDERRTRFVKSYSDNDADWPLWQCLLATAAAPTFLPVVVRDGFYFTDGGLGSYGNPAYVAAREAMEWSNYSPDQVSVFSFGTGWSKAQNFLAQHGAPDRWNLADWAQNAPLLLVGDAARAQSLDIINDYILKQPDGHGIDFRRFQIELQQDISLDDTRPESIALMLKLGEALGQQVLNDQHALGTDPGFDPEGLRDALERLNAARKQRRTG